MEKTTKHTLTCLGGQRNLLGPEQIVTLNIDLFEAAGKLVLSFFITLNNQLKEGKTHLATRAKANIRLKLRSEEQLTTLLHALDPEVKATVTRRATVKLEKDGLYLVLTVDAEDTIALRSTVNAYLRWISAAINVIDAVKEA